MICILRHLTIYRAISLKYTGLGQVLLIYTHDTTAREVYLVYTRLTGIILRAKENLSIVESSCVVCELAISMNAIQLSTLQA